MSTEKPRCTIHPDNELFIVGEHGPLCWMCQESKGVKSGANARQVGGSHYDTGVQHWDFAASNEFDYFQGQITKYVTRWKRKNGIQDLEKAQHFLEKYIEVVRKGRYLPS